MTTTTKETSTMTQKQRDAESKAASDAAMYPDDFGPMPTQDAANSGTAVARGRDLLAALTKKK